jgi:hypothetical protein
MVPHNRVSARRCTITGCLSTASVMISHPATDGFPVCRDCADGILETATRLHLDPLPLVTPLDCPECLVEEAAHDRQGTPSGG